MLSCSHATHQLDYAPRDACALLDSLYESALPAIPWSISGTARFDVNQYRLRGGFVLRVLVPEVEGAGSAGPADTAAEEEGSTQRIFDFMSSSYFGSHREDMTISLQGGTIWILDRERGAYYAGEEAERFIRKQLDIAGNFAEVIEIATGSPPDCAGFERLDVRRSSGGTIVIDGLVGSHRAQFRFGRGGRRITEITWPLEVQSGKTEELRITYRWADDGEALEEIVLGLDRLDWRIKLSVTGQHT